MKRFLLLVLALTFVLCACSPGNGNAETTTAPESPVTPGKWESDMQESIDPLLMGGFVDARSRILLTRRIDGASKLCYYSKADGEFYVFCFDPICKHGDCLAAHSPAFLRYCAYNNRFYYRIEDAAKIYSCSFDASDIRVEYDFMKNSADIYAQVSATLGIVVGKYLYVSYRDEEGVMGKYYFDVESRKLTKYTEGTELSTYSFPTYSYGGKIFFKDIAGNQFRANPDFSEIEPFTFDKDGISRMIHYKNELIMSATDNNYNRFGLRVTNLETGDEYFISKEDMGVTIGALKWVDEKYIYFTNNERDIIGKGKYGDDVANSGEGKLYRCDREGKNIEVVLDMGNMYSFYSMLVCGEDVFIDITEYSLDKDGFIISGFYGYNRYKIASGGKLEFVEKNEVLK